MKTEQHLYLDLLKKSLSFSLWPEPLAQIGYFNRNKGPLRRFLIGILSKGMAVGKYRLAIDKSYSSEKSESGEIWPSYADTMIGMKRLDNLQFCVENAIENNVEGDLIETGVWRGGACIFMRAILKVHGVTDKRIFVADSFEGLPPPDAERYPADIGDKHYQYDFLKVSEEQVRHNFERYGLLDEQVVFLKGFFEDTLPTAPIDKLCVLRLDGDMYSSTMDALNALYPKLSKGGYCIVDDYKLPGCQKAIHDYRDAHGITDELVDIDRMSKYWQNT